MPREAFPSRQYQRPPGVVLPVRRGRRPCGFSRHACRRAATGGSRAGQAAATGRVCPFFRSGPAGRGHAGSAAAGSFGQASAAAGNAGGQVSKLSGQVAALPGVAREFDKAFSLRGGCRGKTH